MRRYFYLPALVFLLSTLSCSEDAKHTEEKVEDTIPANNTSKDVKEADGIGGVYSFGVDIEKGPIGSIRIYPLSADSALFFLNVNKGAPSYNMGLLAGQIKRQNNFWNYSAKDGNATCELQFSFSGDKLALEVVSPQDNCGFGFGVNVGHNYQRTSKEIPTYFLSGEGDTVRFEELKTESKKLK